MNANEAFRSGNIVAAYEGYSSELETNGNCELLLSNRAQCALLLSRFQDALTDCELALSFPADNLALRSKTLFRQGKALMALGRPSEALPILSSSMEYATDPSSVVLALQNATESCRAVEARSIFTSSSVDIAAFLKVFSTFVSVDETAAGSTDHTGSEASGCGCGIRWDVVIGAGWGRALAVALPLPVSPSTESELPSNAQPISRSFHARSAQLRDFVGVLASLCAPPPAGMLEELQASSVSSSTQSGLPQCSMQGLGCLPQFDIRTAAYWASILPATDPSSTVDPTANSPDAVQAGTPSRSTAFSGKNTSMRPVARCADVCTLTTEAKDIAIRQWRCIIQQALWAGRVERGHAQPFWQLARRVVDDRAQHVATELFNMLQVSAERDASIGAIIARAELLGRLVADANCLPLCTAAVAVSSLANCILELRLPRLHSRTDTLRDDVRWRRMRRLCVRAARAVLADACQLLVEDDETDSAPQTSVSCPLCVTASRACDVDTLAAVDGALPVDTECVVYDDQERQCTFRMCCIAATLAIAACAVGSEHDTAPLPHALPSVSAAEPASTPCVSSSTPSHPGILLPVRSPCTSASALSRFSWLHRLLQLSAAATFSEGNDERCQLLLSVVHAALTDISDCALSIWNGHVCSKRATEAAQQFCNTATIAVGAMSSDDSDDASTPSVAAVVCESSHCTLCCAACREPSVSMSSVADSVQNPANPLAGGAPAVRHVDASQTASDPSATDTTSASQRHSSGVYIEPSGECSCPNVGDVSRGVGAPTPILELHSASLRAASAVAADAAEYVTDCSPSCRESMAQMLRRTLHVNSVRPVGSDVGLSLTHDTHFAMEPSGAVCDSHQHSHALAVVCWRCYSSRCAHSLATTACRRLRAEGPTRAAVGQAIAACVATATAPVAAVAPLGIASTMLTAAGALLSAAACCASLVSTPSNGPLSCSLAVAAQCLLQSLQCTNRALCACCGNASRVCGNFPSHIVYIHAMLTMEVCASLGDWKAAEDAAAGAQHALDTVAASFRRRVSSDSVGDAVSLAIRGLDACREDVSKRLAALLLVGRPGAPPRVGDSGMLEGITVSDSTDMLQLRTGDDGSLLHWPVSEGMMACIGTSGAYADSDSSDSDSEKDMSRTRDARGRVWLLGTAARHHPPWQSMRRHSVWSDMPSTVPFAGEGILLVEAPDIAFKGCEGGWC